jgi:site-specific recombinase XerD
VIQKKTGRPVSFEVTPETRGALLGWIAKAGVSAGDFLFFSRIDRDRHLTTRRYARLVHEWVDMIGADPSEYGTHSLRRSTATLIYRQTKNLRAVQLLLGHTKLEHLLYLGVEVDDALEIAEHTGT